MSRPSIISPTWKRIVSRQNSGSKFTRKGEAASDGALKPQLLAVPRKSRPQLRAFRSPSSGSSAALGALYHLLGELQCWRDLAQAEHPASEWSRILRKRVDALVRALRDSA